MNKSEQIDALAGALAKAQSQIKGAVKDAQNPFFKSKYADLSSVWEACREALTANGLSIVQAARALEAGVEVETVLLHGSGQFISETLAIPVAKSDAQGFGSALTYCRRYGLAAMVGVAPEDDDGNAAATAKPKEGEFRPKLAKPITPATGAMDSLGADEKLRAQLVASLVVDAYNADDHQLAYRNWTEADLDSDQKVAAWALIPSNIRSHLKRLQETAKRLAEENHVATQA